MPQKSKMELEVRQPPCPKGAKIGPPDVELQVGEDDWSEAIPADFSDRKWAPGAALPRELGLADDDGTGRGSSGVGIIPTSRSARSDYAPSVLAGHDSGRLSLLADSRALQDREAVRWSDGGRAVPGRRRRRRRI